MAAIVSITAKLMLIVDAVLGQFATVSMTALNADYCNINQVSGSLTNCGQALVDSLVSMVYFAVQLGGQLLPALGVM